MLNYISSNNLQNSAYMLGYKINPYKYLTNADLYICSSLFEGYSTVVAEVLVLGITVITTECSGMINLLGDSEIGLINHTSAESLYDGLNDMVMNNYYKLEVIESFVLIGHLYVNSTF